MSTDLLVVVSVPRFSAPLICIVYVYMCVNMDIYIHMYIYI